MLRSLLIPLIADQKDISRSFRSLCFTRILYSFLLIPRSVLEDLYSTNLQAGVNMRGTLPVPAVTTTDKRNRYLFFTSC